MKISGFSFLVVLALAGCGAQKPDADAIAPPSSGDISAKDAWSLCFTNRSNAAFVIIDVRTPEEYAGGHVEGATNLDFLAPDFDSRIRALDTNRTYFVYCHSGGRSADASSRMKAFGANAVYTLSGGLDSWEAEKLPLVK
jgi:rhodanese-related sulfurtransferase